MEYPYNEITVQNDPKLEKEIDIQVQETLGIVNTSLGKDSLHYNIVQMQGKKHSRLPDRSTEFSGKLILQNDS